MLLNCGVGEDSWESLGLQGDPTSPFWRKLVLGVPWKDWCWSWKVPVLWPPDAKSWLIWKDLDSGKNWGQEQKGTMEDEMVRWHRWLYGHGFGWTLGVGDGQGGLACCTPWGHKELDTTEWVNWTELNWRVFVCIESIQEGLEYLNKLIAIFHFVEKVYLTWFHLTLCVKMA